MAKTWRDKAHREIAGIVHPQIYADIKTVAEFLNDVENYVTRSREE